MHDKGLMMTHTQQMAAQETVMQPTTQPTNQLIMLQEPHVQTTIVQPTTQLTAPHQVQPHVPTTIVQSTTQLTTSEKQPQAQPKVKKKHPLFSSQPVQQQQQPQTLVQTTVMQPSTQVTTVTTRSSSGMRDAIPALPMPLAVILCIINFILPGIGTIIAAFSVLCCGNVGQSGGGRFGTFCINFWVGILQLLTIGMILGWVWSIMWGYAFIASAASDGNETSTSVVVSQPGMMMQQNAAQPQQQQQQQPIPVAY